MTRLAAYQHGSVAITLSECGVVVLSIKVFCAIVVATYVVSDDARAEMARCTPGYFLSAITERDLRIQFG
jgi:hypothetical protein